MSDDNTEIDDRKVQHTREHDFQGGLKKNGSDIGGGSYTDEDAQDAVGNNVDNGLSYDDANAEVGMNVIQTGVTTLSNGEATVDTGVSVSEIATFFVALGPASNDVDIAAEVRSASGGNYEVDIVETDTDTGGPTVEYDIIRVR